MSPFMLTTERVDLLFELLQRHLAAATAGRLILFISTLSLIFPAPAANAGGRGRHEGKDGRLRSFEWGPDEPG